MRQRAKITALFHPITGWNSMSCSRATNSMITSNESGKNTRPKLLSSFRRGRYIHRTGERGTIWFFKSDTGETDNFPQTE